MTGGPKTRQQQRAEHQSRRTERRLAVERAQKRRRLITFIGVPVAILLIAGVVGFAILSGNDAEDAADFTPFVAAELDPSIPIDGRAIGRPDAPVTLVEWGDYQ